MSTSDNSGTSRSLEYLFEMMHHGRYSFDQFLNLPVDKHFHRVHWRSRTIYKPSKSLRALHTFLNIFVLGYLPVNERVCFSYRKGSTLSEAVAVHAGSRAFFQTDLAKFFDSITSQMVRDALASAATPAGDLKDHIARIAQLTTIDDKLAIGFSTSPLLSNSCLIAFDDEFERVCRERELKLSRYADDIVVSGRRPSDLANMEELISTLLHDTVGPTLKINSQKSRTVRVGRKVKILGLNILPSGRVTVDREMREKVEVQLHFYLTDRVRLAEILGDTEEGLRKLSGYISHIHSADPLYLEKLRRKFGTTVIDAFLHRSVQ